MLQRPGSACSELQILVLGIMIGIILAVSLSLPLGAVISTIEKACPPKWAPADGRDGRPDLRGKIGRSGGPYIFTRGCIKVHE